jgi:hypothetical protein
MPRLPSSLGGVTRYVIPGLSALIMIRSERSSYGSRTDCGAGS